MKRLTGDTPPNSGEGARIDKLKTCEKKRQNVTCNFSNEIVILVFCVVMSAKVFSKKTS